MAIVTNLARCYDCETVFGLSLDRLHSVSNGHKLGLIDGVPITCGHPDCAERKADKVRRAYAETLVERVMEKLAAAAPTSSESEQDGEALLLSMMKGE